MQNNGLTKSKKIAVYNRGNTQEVINNYRIINNIINKYNKLNDKYSITYYEDVGYSGNNNHRPDLESLILSIENKDVDILITPKIETLSRDILFLEFELYPRLLDFKVDLITNNGLENIKNLMMSNDTLKEKMKEKYEGEVNEL